MTTDTKKNGGGRMSLGCFQKMQKRVGDACPQGALKNHQKRWGTHVLRVLSNIAIILSPKRICVDFVNAILVMC
jgi:hypothetical protein